MKTQPFPSSLFFPDQLMKRLAARCFAGLLILSPLTVISDSRPADSGKVNILFRCRLEDSVELHHRHVQVCNTSKAGVLCCLCTIECLRRAITLTVDSLACCIYYQHFQLPRFAEQFLLLNLRSLLWCVSWVSCFSQMNINEFVCRFFCCCFPFFLLTHQIFSSFVVVI